MVSVSKPPRQGEWANPRLLRWARERVGLAPERIGVLTKGLISEQELAAWEGGHREPLLSHLEQLAGVYRCPVAYFFWHSPPRGKDFTSQGWDFRGLRRGKTQVLDYDTRVALIRLRELSDQVASFVDELGIHWEARFDEVAPSDDLKQIERIADSQRAKLQLGIEERGQFATAEELFAAVRRRIEDMGVFVLALRVNPRQVRGASLWVAGLPPMILVNRADAEAATGRLFTLLHEYVHLLTRRSGRVCDFSGQDHGSRLEVFANRVAARILLPSGPGLALISHRIDELGLQHYRTRWSDAALDNLRRPFKVSRDVIAIFLEDQDMAPRGFYRQKLAQWESRKGGRGFGRGRPLTMPERKLMELGTNFSRLLAQGHAEGHVPLLHVAHLLDTTVEQAERFLQWPSVQSLLSH